MSKNNKINRAKKKRVKQAKFKSAIEFEQGFQEYLKECHCNCDCEDLVDFFEIAKLPEHGIMKEETEVLPDGTKIITDDELDEHGLAPVIPSMASDCKTEK